MIDLTPLDVRNKRGDFAKALRGYDPNEVDTFLELVGERLEVLVKENLQLKERAERLAEQVTAQEGREKAVQEALVTAQALREDVKQQAEREAGLVQREAQAAIDRAVAEAERMIEERKLSLAEIERARIKFLKAFRSLLERELDAIEVEEARAPLADLSVEIDLGPPEAPADAAVEPGPEAEAAQEPEEESERLQEDAHVEEASPDAADVAAAADGECITDEGPPEGSGAEDEDSPVDVFDLHGIGRAGDDEATEAAPEPETAHEPEALADDDEAERARTDDAETPSEAEPEEAVDHAEAEDAVAAEASAGEEDGDDSLWLNSLLDGESRDEGRWG